MPLYRDEAIVLRTHKLGEADRIITMLTRTRGRVRAVAKGVRRTKSRFGSRLEPGMVIDVQCYEGRNLDTVTQVETLAPYGDAIARDYTAYTCATSMLETALQLHRGARAPDPAVPPARRRAAVARRAQPRRGPRARRLPAALARHRGLGPELRRLRASAARRARTAPSTCRPVGPCAPPAARPARAHRPRRRSSCSRRCSRATGTSPTRATSGIAARATGSCRPSSSGTSSEDCARCASSNEPEPEANPIPTDRRPMYAKPFPHPSGATPPAIPANLLPKHVAIVMDGNGRWANARGLPRTKGHEAGEASLLDVVAGARRGRRDAPVGVRLLDGELASLARGGALPHGLQPRRHPPPPRPAERVGRAHALGRPRAAASGASVIKELEIAAGADGAEHRADPLLLRQLRRPRRDRRRRPADRPRRQGRSRYGRDRSTRRRSRGTSTSRRCPTSTSSCAAPASSARRNFLLWQSAYAEMVFQDRLWPDYDRRDLWAAIEAYVDRDRRYGGAVDTPTTAP